MFRYSWKCLYKECNKDPEIVIDILKCYESGKVNIKQAAIINKISKCKKTGYILNLKGLLDAEVTNFNKAVYLYIASKRNIMDYLVYEQDWLNIKIASVDVSKIVQNRLFELDDNNIYFKY